MAGVRSCYPEDVAMPPIYVPSRSRHTDMGNGVLRFSTPGMRQSLNYVVPVEQREQYAQALSDAGIEDVGGVLACPEQGIAATRLWIGRHARELGQRKFLMLDDDIWFYVRESRSSVKLRKVEPCDMDQLLVYVDRLLDAYGHVGISPRQGNDKLGVGNHELVAECCRTLRALAYRTEEFLSVEHGRVQVMEDFDVNLQLLRKGIPNANIGFWAQDQRKGTAAPGGCSDYRDHQLQEAAAKRLAQLHPGYVRVRTKKNKSGGDFGHRTEVTISWKKAFLDSNQAGLF